MALVDLEMPEADGLALVRWLAQQPERHLPVVLMDTALHRGDPQERLAGRIMATLTKPVRPSDLLDLLLQALGQTPSQAARARGLREPSPLPGNLRVLVAEDTPFNQKFIARLMERWRQQVTIVENGHEALAAMERETFDLVLMDVQMPEMDGFATTAAIRRREAQRGGPAVPIIAMTAHAMKGDRERCLAAGMNAYVSKPIAIEALQNAIREVLGTPPSPPAAAPSEPAAAGLDRRALLRAFDDDWDFLREAVQIFLHDCPPMMADLEAALDRGDDEALRRSAHAVKGMLGNFLAETAAGLAADLERCGRGEEPLAARALLAGLQREVAGLMRELRTLTDGGGA
jgi:CheY-like chemotaxis protein/HPt (histidine-containing phosphotransfer) domain-containing protein